MKIKSAVILLIAGFLLGAIAYAVNLPIVNMICYTLASLLIIGAMALAVGPWNFVIMLVVYAILVLLYALGLYLTPVPFALHV